VNGDSQAAARATLEAAVLAADMHDGRDQRPADALAEERGAWVAAAAADAAVWEQEERAALERQLRSIQGKVGPHVFPDLFVTIPHRGIGLAVAHAVSSPHPAH
jgi:hypothetical protein